MPMDSCDTPLGLKPNGFCPLRFLVGTVSPGELRARLNTLRGWCHTTNYWAVAQILLHIESLFDTSRRWRLSHIASNGLRIIRNKRLNTVVFFPKEPYLGTCKHDEVFKVRCVQSSILFLVRKTGKEGLKSKTPNHWV